MCLSVCFSACFSAWAPLARSKAETAATATTKRIVPPTQHATERRRANGSPTPNDHAGGRVKSSLSGAIQTVRWHVRGGDLDAMCRLDHCAWHERSARLRHLPGDYSLAPNAGCGRLFSSLRL